MDADAVNPGVTSGLCLGGVYPVAGLDSIASIVLYGYLQLSMVMQLRSQSRVLTGYLYSLNKANPFSEKTRAEI